MKGKIQISLFKDRLEVAKSHYERGRYRLAAIISYEIALGLLLRPARPPRADSNVILENYCKILLGEIDKKLDE
jgi:hypothetical protein